MTRSTSPPPRRLPPPCITPGTFTFPPGRLSHRPVHAGFLCWCRNEQKRCKSRFLPIFSKSARTQTNSTKLGGFTLLSSSQVASTHFRLLSSSPSRPVQGSGQKIVPVRVFSLCPLRCVAARQYGFCPPPCHVTVSGLRLRVKFEAWSAPPLCGGGACLHMTS